MSWRIAFLALILILSYSGFLPADDHDDTPPISITSPDTGLTFAYGTIKDHSLQWNSKTKMLFARITFTDAEQNSGQPNDETQEFRLPGVTLDETQGIFFATTAKGELIPVAHFKKTLFFKVIETTPNAVVRIFHPRGNVTVMLQAISPNDPAMHGPASDGDSDGTRKVNIHDILR